MKQDSTNRSNSLNLKQDKPEGDDKPSNRRLALDDINSQQESLSKQRQLLETGFQCTGVTKFEENGRAANWFETPVFFRMGFFNQFKLNLLSFPTLEEYESNRWYKIDLLLDWASEDTALFLDGTFRTKTEFFTQKRDS